MCGPYLKRWEIVSKWKQLLKFCAEHVKFGLSLEKKRNQGNRLSYDLYLYAPQCKAKFINITGKQTLCGTEPFWRTDLEYLTISLDGLTVQPFLPCLRDNLLLLLTPFINGLTVIDCKQRPARGQYSRKNVVIFDIIVIRAKTFSTTS